LKITIIITAILFLYAAFSTIFHETALVGNIGKLIGDTNMHLFGMLAYVNIFILFYPLYKLYSDHRVRRDIDFYLGWILLFIALVILEALVLERKEVGYLGTQIISFLTPYIGKAGLWLLWLMSISLSLVFILDDDFNISIITSKSPRVSFSTSWFSSSLSGIKSVLKKIFTNPFSSPSLEYEMMPILEQEELKIKKPSPKRKTSVKKAPVKRVKVKPVPEEKLNLDEGDDPVLNEILELEHEMEISQAKEETKTSTLSSNVEIVEELEENSKLMDAIDKGEVAKPKNFKLPKLDFLQKHLKKQKK